MLTASAALAQDPPAPRWNVADGSVLTFTAVQQDAEFEGRFESFDAAIEFAADALSSSAFDVTVDIASVNTDYDDRDETLRGPEFFDAERWPQGRFEASRFESLGGDAYEAVGELTLRDQTRPLTVPFTFTPRGTAAELTGEVVISRLEFGIGQGEWTDTTWVGDEVTVRFRLNLERRD
jgi:polyisoprenoid-binding protein YceI